MPPPELPLIVQLWIDVKHAVVGVAVHCQIVRAKAADTHAPVHEQLAAGQRDYLSLERGIEVDRVAVVCVRKRLPQRA